MLRRSRRLRNVRREYRRKPRATYPWAEGVADASMLPKQPTVGLPVHGDSLRLLGESCANCVPTADRRITNPTIRFLAGPALFSFFAHCRYQSSPIQQHG